MTAELPGIEPTPFSIFWSHYPRRCARKVAEKAFAKLKPDDKLLNLMLAAIKKQSQSDGWKRGFIPYPATWLNQERWTDETVVLPGGVVHQQRLCSYRQGQGETCGMAAQHDPVTGQDLCAHHKRQLAERVSNTSMPVEVRRALGIRIKA